MTIFVEYNSHALLPKDIAYLDPVVFLGKTPEAAAAEYRTLRGHDPAVVYHVKRPNGKQAIYIPANGEAASNAGAASGGDANHTNLT